MRTALIVSAALAQIGEFSFILAGLGVELRPAARGRFESDCRRRAAFDHVQSGGVQCAIAFAGREWHRRRQETVMVSHAAKNCSGVCVKHQR